jgi:methylmalonyl-CoA mutase N-terminal domain/subunit
MMLRFHAQTGGVTLTAQEPDNNVVRVAWQALAAVLGGAQSLHTNSKDEALALPSESAVKLALRTQQLIAHESGVTNTIDPLGGSFYVEDLTDRIESEAAQLIAEIDALGGMPRAIESGFVCGKIEQSGYEWCMQVERKERIVVGVNEYAEGGLPDMQLFEVGEEVRQRQIDKLNEVKARRDASAVERSLAALKTAAANESQNVMPLVLDAVRAYATIGEICGVLREVFGEYEEKCQM